MKPDDNLSDSQEIEARIVAWVAGEASPLEIAALEELLRQNPELERFKRRIETVHALVGEAMDPSASTAKLSPERRAKLLEAIGVFPATRSPAGPVDSSARGAAPVVEAIPRRRRIPGWAFPAAACLLVGWFVAYETTGGFDVPGEREAQDRALKTPVFQEERQKVETGSSRPDEEKRASEPAAEAVFAFAPGSIEPKPTSKLGDTKHEEGATISLGGEVTVGGSRRLSAIPLSVESTIRDGQGPSTNVL